MRLITGRTTFATLRPTGNIFSMYHDITSGRLNNRSVSAVGAQSTMIASYFPAST